MQVFIRFFTIHFKFNDYFNLRFFLLLFDFILYFSDGQSFFDCVEGVVGNKCNNTQKAFFSTIWQPVFSYLLPHCAEKQEGAPPLKSPVTFKNLLNEVDTDSENAPIPAQNKSEIAGVQGLNKVYSDSSAATTISPPNISEVVVVHQHVIITMTYKDKNAANQINVPFFLIVLLCLAWVK